MPPSKRSPSPRSQRPASPRSQRPASPAGSQRAPKPKGAAAKSKAGSGGPPNWPTCEYCGQKVRIIYISSQLGSPSCAVVTLRIIVDVVAARQPIVCCVYVTPHAFGSSLCMSTPQFSPSSISIHQTKCRDKPELLEEQAGVEALKRIEGPRPPNPNADWEQCPNCGERYGEFALPPHMKRCKRLLPHGKKKDGVQYGSGPPPKGEEAASELEPIAEAADDFDDHGSGLSREELAWLRTLFDKHDADGNQLLDEAELGALLRECAPQRARDADRLVAEFKVADLNDDGTVDFPELARYYGVLKDMLPGGGLSSGEIEWLRMLFSRFDADHDGFLQMGELADLLRQCFPSRAADTRRLAREVQAADVNGDSLVSFHEFLRAYEMLIATGAEFDELAKMFHVFDKDGNGALDRGEFLSLLHQVFPDRCDENEAHVDREFGAADKDGSNAIDFAEFKAYYSELVTLYDRLKAEQEAEEAAREAEAAAKAAAEAAAAAKAAAEAAAALKAAQEREAAEAKARAEAEARAKAEAEARDAAEAEAKAHAEAQAKARAEAEAAARAAAEAKAARQKAAAEARAKAEAEAEAERQRKAEEAARIAAAMVACEGCGERFLPHLLAQHQRSCEACRPSLDDADRTNGGMFVPCSWCSRTFFVRVPAGSAHAALHTNTHACAIPPEAVWSLPPLVLPSIAAQHLPARGHPAPLSTPVLRYWLIHVRTCGAPLVLPLLLLRFAAGPLASAPAHVQEEAPWQRRWRHPPNDHCHEPLRQRRNGG